MAPEYLAHGQLTEKADVYSFGVLLLEVVTGMGNNRSKTIDDTDSLLSTAWKYFKKGTVEELFDPNLMMHTYPNIIFQKDAIRVVHFNVFFVDSFSDSRPNKRARIHQLRLEEGARKAAEELEKYIPGTEYVIDSDAALDLPLKATKIATVCGGYIALEFAGIFNGLQSEVHVFIRQKQVLRGFDDEHMSLKGTEFHTTESPQVVIKSADGSFSLKTNKGTTEGFSHVMFATGISLVVIWSPIQQAFPLEKTRNHNRPPSSIYHTDGRLLLMGLAADSGLVLMRQQYCSLLLTSISSMLNEKGPTTFFNFDGYDSHTQYLSPASRSILLLGPAEFYHQNLAKALLHEFETKLLMLDIVGFYAKVNITGIEKAQQRIPTNHICIILKDT
ncbi:FAD-dependent pyridine nucleotide-disulfide oxidoreductase [Artemisia annua]|uniref:FAD-dependent pyridine nucleotide-disulfide oxidoreductase n=1 Tax=Artemisia annua TaxID=35608 RepID=A0A2U1P352_ARTAN|nr:FAD-dependent pyridine nucleotide-disulfide oxidoreductase [Artemisia annua]